MPFVYSQCVAKAIIANGGINKPFKVYGFTEGSVSGFPISVYFEIFLLMSIIVIPLSIIVYPFMCAYFFYNGIIKNESPNFEFEYEEDDESEEAEEDDDEASEKIEEVVVEEDDKETERTEEKSKKQSRILNGFYALVESLSMLLEIPILPITFNIYLYRMNREKLKIFEKENLKILDLDEEEQHTMERIKNA